MATNSTSIGHFGEALRHERQRRAVSLEDISRTTKVTVHKLKALEADAFEQLPGGILSKGIVRGYVRYLGLDESFWIARFLDASEPRAEEPDPAESIEKDWVANAIHVSGERVHRLGELNLRWAGVLLLLLLLSCFGWIVWGYVQHRVDSSGMANRRSAVPHAYADSSALKEPGSTSH
jgi:cytoskeletal protein RodZ